jgi:hypothetical protein
VRLRRGRFADVIARQLDLFERENAELLGELAGSLDAYRRAPADEAEERYAAYDDLLDDGREALAMLRDGFKWTLDDDARDEYEAAFERAAGKRFPQIASGLDEV